MIYPHKKKLTPETALALNFDIDDVLNSDQKNQVRFDSDKSQFIIFSNRNNPDTEIVSTDVAIPISPTFTLIFLKYQIDIFGSTPVGVEHLIALLTPQYFQIPLTPGCFLSGTL